MEGQHEFDAVVDAACRFIEKHITIGSTAIFDNIKDNLHQCKTLDDIFITSFNSNLLDLESIIQLLIILYATPTRYGNKTNKIDLVKCLDLIIAKYDLDINEYIWDFYNSESDSFEDTEESSSSGDVK